MLGRLTFDLEDGGSIGAHCRILLSFTHTFLFLFSNLLELLFDVISLMFAK